MSATGFVDGSGNDLIEVFQPIGTATKIVDVGFVSILNGDKDLSAIFRGYTSGAKASITGIVYNNLDLAEWFQKKGPMTPLTSMTPAVEPTMIGNDYLYTFTTTTTYTATWSPGDYTVRYLCVAGGGGGGRRVGAGGGAGGVLTNTVSFSVSTATNITITVGVGGTGMSVSAGPAATNGGNSSITSSMLNVTSVGGGGGTGISFPGLVGKSGGSGAGGVYNSVGAIYQGTSGEPGAGTSGQGNSGGYGFVCTGESYYTGGGGGGAGDFGGHGFNTGTCGYGGAGILSNITGTDTYYGGGGGGALSDTITNTMGGTGGIGGGGNGGFFNWSLNTSVLPTSGTANTGGGGGGEAAELNSGGNGGSGIVILRITPNLTTHILSISQGPTLIPNMFMVGNERIYIFNTVGTYTVSFNAGYGIRYLCVAGGGGGGVWDGPGGGAGGLLTGTFIPATGTNYTITVGNGGVGQLLSNSVPVRGENSSISTVATSIGGGGAAGKMTPNITLNAMSGGSGAGGTWFRQNNQLQNPGSGTSGQGNNGGIAFSDGVTGGGGGSGGVGGVGNTTVSGNGGVGIQSNITGSNLYYGGGGAGGKQSNRTISQLAIGGLGGGGRGGLLVYGRGNNLDTMVYGAHGAPNTGGGGGGTGNTLKCGNGGSGIVILRTYTLPLTSSPAITPEFFGSDIIYRFTTVGTYNITFNSGNYSVIYLCVAGGGAGGSETGGGGGAGGVLTGTFFVSNTSSSYTITVGSGGIIAKPSTSSSNGSNSSISTIATSIGGGGGAGLADGVTVTRSGGSGAGQSPYSSGVGQGTSGQGNNGGIMYFINGGVVFAGGGGGGAGGVGGNGTSSIAGNGGIGVISNITGTSNYYGGGGGGSTELGNSYPSSVAVGGSGGGGNGARINYTTQQYQAATAGTPNTGGGGGGGAGWWTGTYGGAGGSGVVILRVTITGTNTLQATNQTFPDTYATFVKSPTVVTDTYSNTNRTLTVSGATTYKNGLYSVSSSSAYASWSHPYLAFCNINPDADPANWASGGTTTTSPNNQRTLSNTGYRTYDRSGYNASGVYQGATGVLFTTTYLFNGSFTTMDGEWIQISFPYLIKLTSIIIHKYPGDAFFVRMPKTGVILGSNDGTIWNFIHNFSSGSLVGNGPWTYNISTTNSYTFIRFVINTNYGGPILNIKQIFYTGDIYT